MTSEVLGILPPPTYRHRKPPSPLEPSPSQLEKQKQHHQQQYLDEKPQSQQQQQQGDNGTSRTTTSTSIVVPPVSMAGMGSALDANSHQSLDLSYMHRPPAILPNYGKKTRGSVLPKSNVSRVLLYDNLTQQSMLDVRINSIRSQSYKTHRELDMHMKSFMTRRKFREKALKKITRVEHRDDYTEFLQEQEPPDRQHSHPSYFTTRRHGAGVGGGPFHLPLIGSNLKTSSKKSTGLSTSQSLLSVCDQNNAKTTSGAHQTKPPKAQTPSSRTSSVADEAFDNPKYDQHISLPAITLSTPSIDKPLLANEKDSEDVRSRKLGVGIRFVPGDHGMTRLFNVLAEVEEEEIEKEQSGKVGEELQQQPGPIGLKQSPPHSITADAATSTFQDKSDDTISNADENNNSVQMASTGTQTTSKEKLNPIPRISNKPRASIFQLQKKKEEEELLRRKEEELERKKKASLGDITMDLHPEKPIIDSRFLHLRRLLVPQEPPNEGFAELSPSFPKYYPSFKDLSPRSKRKERDERKKRSKHSRIAGHGGDFSDGESDFLTDSSDEEAEEVGEVDHGHV